MNAETCEKYLFKYLKCGPTVSDKVLRKVFFQSPELYIH